MMTEMCCESPMKLVTVTDGGALGSSHAYFQCDTCRDVKVVRA